MHQTLGDFLKITSADDRFIVNIKKDGERVYYGYENEVPEEIKSFRITKIYIDWASEVLGIHVSDQKEKIPVNDENIINAGMKQPS